MTRSLRRRAGAAVAVVGIALSTVGLVSATAPAGAADDTRTAPICNQQKASTPNDNCEGEKFHGTLTTSFQDDGALVFDVAAREGFAGWRAIKICIPQVGPTDRADCTGNDAPVSPDQYVVSGASDVVEEDKEVTFSCDGAVRAVVEPAAFDGSDDPSYTVHLSTCGGGTDEAFGTATRATASPTTTTTSTTSTSTTSTTAPATTTTTTSTTAPATTTTTSTTAPATTTTTPTSTPGPNGRPNDGSGTLAVLDEAMVRPGAAALPMAVANADRPIPVPGRVEAAPATLARTGTSTTATLLGLGLALVLAGGAAMVTSQPPQLALATSLDSAPSVVSVQPSATGSKRSLLILTALLVAGTLLPRIGRRSSR